MSPAPDWDLESLIDLREKGRADDGSVIHHDQRLYMQFLGFGDCNDTGLLIDALREADFDSVLYEDINDFTGVGLLVWHTDPTFFVHKLRVFLQNSAFSGLTPKPEFTMFGRTYTIGYESDLQRVLVDRPIERVINPELEWAIWYPLRRKGSFQDLSDRDQMKVLGEHGMIGRAFGEANLAQDVRLACHGIDKHDNDFVIGILSSHLTPPSVVVQTMRKTDQTSHYLEKLGPFFVGKAAWQSPGPK